MSNRPEFIQLEPGDDANSVRDRLSFIRGQRVLLIWPEDGTVLTRKLDLVLIQREAMRRAIRLAVVTHDPQVIQHATDLNISSFETIGASERGRWKRGRSKVFVNRFQRPKDTPEPDDLMDVASRVRGEGIPRRMRIAGRLVLLLAVLAVLFSIGYVVLPTATVTIQPAQNTISMQIEVIADPQIPNVEVENRLIPATRISVQIEDTGTIETTGTQDLGATTAIGSVVFINQTTAAIAIPPGTIVTTSAGEPIQFQTTQAANLSGGVGLQIEVPIEALSGSAGENGNLDSGLINTVVGPLANQVTVRNITPTSGGASRSQPVVSIGDQERLLATLRQQLQARAYIEMQPRLTETQFIILETVRITEERSDWTTFSAAPDDIANTLTLTMRAVVEAVAVDEQFGQQIVYAQMSSRVGAGEEIKPGSVGYERGPVINIDSDTGRITFVMSGSGLVRQQINIQELGQRLAGLSNTDAIALLVSEVPLAQGTVPQVVISPDWFGQMPILASRITIEIIEAAPE